MSRSSLRSIRCPSATQLLASFAPVRAVRVPWRQHAAIRDSQSSRFISVVQGDSNISSTKHGDRIANAESLPRSPGGLVDPEPGLTSRKAVEDGETQSRDLRTCGRNIASPLPLKTTSEMSSVSSPTATLDIAHDPAALLEHLRAQYFQKGTITSPQIRRAHLRRSVRRTKMRQSAKIATFALTQPNGIILQNHSFRRDIAVKLKTLDPFPLSDARWRRAMLNLTRALRKGQTWDISAYYTMDPLSYALIKMLRDKDVERFRTFWYDLDENEQRRQWPRVALSLLTTSPETTLDFLLATSDPPFPSSQRVEDCLYHILKFHRHISKSSSFRSVIRICLHPERWMVHHVPQRAVRFFIIASEHDDVVEAFELMRKHKKDITKRTVLCFVNCFTKFGDVDRALDAFRLLQAFPRIEDKKKNYPIVKHCCKLLTLDTIIDGPDGRNFKILPQLLEMGIVPHRDMMNVVLHNAFKIGDQQLFQDIVDYMREQGFQFDSYTYVTVLSEAVARADLSRVEAILEELDFKTDIKNMPQIRTKIFHAQFVFMVKNMDYSADTAETFSHILRIYSQFYELKPLVDLGIVPPSYAEQNQGKVVKTSVVPLFVVLSTYLRCKRSSNVTLRLYQRFQQLAAESRPGIVELAETEPIYNEFIHALRGDSSGLQSSVMIVEDMIHPSSKPIVSINGVERELRRPKPSTLTWTLLLSSFTWAREYYAAEKVKEMMTRHNVRYDQSMWNHIINGFANEQKPTDVAKAIRQMEAEGFTMNPYILKALRRLRDPERLRVAIEEMDRQAAETTPRSEGSNEMAEMERLLEDGLKRLAEKKAQKKAMAQSTL